MTLARVFDHDVQEKLTEIKQYICFSDMQTKGFTPSKYGNLGIATAYGTMRRKDNANGKRDFN